MIPSNPMRTVKDYGSSAQYLEAPSDEEIAKGTIPLDTLPAAWWNWMWRDTNSAVNEAKTGMTSIVTEIVNVLTAANIQPSQLTENQLLSAIRVIAQQYGTSTSAGAVKSSLDSGKLNIEAAGTAVINGLGTPTSLNTTNKVVVAAVNEILAALNAYISSNDSAIQSLENSKAPNNHASSATTYGAGTGSNYGHVKLSDAVDSTSSTSDGVAATPNAVKTVQDNLDSHTNNTNTAHGATSAATANKIIVRDAAGRAKVADPVDDDDIVNKKYMTEHTGTTDMIDQVQSSLDTHIEQTMNSVHGATAAATANRLMIRDASGRARVANPSDNADIANKGWVNSLRQSFFDAAHPVGDIFIQYPSKGDFVTKTPAQLYNVNGITSTWVELNYGGVFFRSNGGSAEKFGEGLQGAQLPNIRGHFQPMVCGTSPTYFQKTGAFSSTTYMNNGGAIGDGSSRYSVIFDASQSNSVYTDNGEVRPKNYTVRVWCRTA